VDWTDEPPRQSGIYLFMDALDTLAEEISTLDVDVPAGVAVPAYNLGTPPAPISGLRGHWFGPLPGSDRDPPGA